MRTLMITLGAAVSALAVATPASAQYFPQPSGYAYGYDNYGQARRLQARIDRLQWHIRQLDRQDILSKREARALRTESVRVEQRLRAASYRGLSRWERSDIEQRLARLEWRIQREARDGRNLGRRYDGSYSMYRDVDRDGRDDSREHEQWHDKHDDDDHDD